MPSKTRGPSEGKDAGARIPQISPWARRKEMASGRAARCCTPFFARMRPPLQVFSWLVVA